MRISYNWLQTFFTDPLPSPEEVQQIIGLHAFEVENVFPYGNDTIFDIHVLPDRAHDCLSHRGLAKELSVLLERPLRNDPLGKKISIKPLLSKKLLVKIEDSVVCPRYSAVLIEGLTVGASPEWLRQRIESMGGRSINNIVDAMNFVMFNMGQPLHAFDAGKLSKSNGSYCIEVKNAQSSQKIKTLGGEEYILENNALLITDGITGEPLGVAGIKGGIAAEVTQDTKDIIIESANFNSKNIRKTSQALRIRTDASQRFENELSPELAIYGLEEAVKLITELTGGSVEGFVDVYPKPQESRSIELGEEETNRLLGTDISDEEIENIFRRFGFSYKKDRKHFTVMPPSERLDLFIKEDLIAEIGRVYGYKKIPTIIPTKEKPREISKLFYYTHKVRTQLASFGFSEIYTTSFAHDGDVELVKSLASDKQFLRKYLFENMLQALVLNMHNLPLSGVKIFEIGTVFGKDAEEVHLVLGTDKKSKKSLEEAIQNLSTALGTDIKEYAVKTASDVIYGDGKTGMNLIYSEFNITLLLDFLPPPEKYIDFPGLPDIVYKSFSTYPFVLRDIAVFIPQNTPKTELEELIKAQAGDLLIRMDLFDTFKQEPRISYAYHLVFQSYEKTLADAEINTIMGHIARAIGERDGWHIR